MEAEKSTQDLRRDMDATLERVLKAYQTQYESSLPLNFLGIGTLKTEVEALKAEVAELRAKVEHCA